jgi:hypothetical protein
MSLNMVIITRLKQVSLYALQNASVYFNMCAPLFYSILAILTFIYYSVGMGVALQT